MTGALEQVATTAESIAHEQLEVAAQARSIEHLRKRGWSWTQIFSHQESPFVLDLLRSSGRKIAELTRLVSRLVAEGMSVEGHSRREIARQLGVTHQRVSTILKRSHSE
jgi:DNA invertase Pin-like site-specific DNA recombinase